MKKVILTFVFLGTFTVSNAENLMEYNDKCHAVACQYLESVEQMFSEVEIDEGDAQWLYDYAYNDCVG